MLRYLRRVDDLTTGKLRWGILTNGARWRLYYQGSRSVSEQFFEMDLAALLDLPGHNEGLFALTEDDRRHWLKVFALVFRREAFLAGTADPRTFHQRAIEEGRFYEERVAASLSALVFGQVFPELASAIAAATPEASLPEVREATLVLLYRLLFILYAEDRDLLPVRNTSYDDYALREKVRGDVGHRKDRGDVFSTSAARYWLAIDYLCRVPHFLKSSIYNDQLWLLSRWVRERRDASEDESPDAGQSTRLGQDASDRRQQRIQLFTTDARSKLQNVRFAHQFVKYAKIGYRQNTFKFYHVMGTHLPLRMTRQFEYRELERSRDSLKEVATGVVGLVKIMFDQLKDLGVFQESLIVVAADHGMWTSVAKVRIPDDLALNDENSVPTSRSQLPERKGTALPLVLVKRPGSSGPLLANDAPVALADIPRTIVSELGYAGEAFPGQSVFEVAVDSPRERKVFFSTFRQNPAYSEPYRSTMTEFLVSGFSWLDSSWKKTGKLYPPPDASSGTTTSGQD